MIKVLHVDDEPSFLELVKFFLQREGDFEIETSVTAKDAIEKLKEREFDAIVADYVLPEINGIDLLKILRAQGNDIPFILLTGRGREEVAAEALNNGADFYLQKGTNPQLQFATLGHVIRQSVRRRRSEMDTQKTERFLSDVFSSIQDGISVLDKDLTILKVNATMERWYAHKAPLVGKKCYDAYHGRDASCLICPVHETLKSGKAAHEVVPKVGPQGEVVGWLDLFSYPMMDNETGELTGIIEYVRDISDRRKAEQVLNNTLERYKELEETIDKSPVVIVLWPPEPKAPEAFVSNSIGQFGYLREDFDPGRMVIEDIIHPDDIKRVMDHVAEYIKKGDDELQDEYRVVTKSNEIRWVKDHTFARRGPDGKPVQYESLLIDITSRKLAQENLEELTARLQAIVEAFPDLYFIVRPDGTILEYKASQEDDLYVPPTAFLGKRMQVVLPPDVGEVYGQMVIESARDGAMKVHDYSLVMDGEKRFFEGRVVPMSKDKLLVVVRNITPRKKAEVALQERDIQFTKLSAHVPGMIYQFVRRADGTYCVPFTSDAIRDIFGCSPEDVREDFSPIAKLILAEDLTKVVDSIEYSANHLTEWRCEYRVRIPGGLVKWVFGHSTPERMADGSIVWYGFNTDITEQKRGELAIKAVNEKLHLLGHVTRHDTLNQLAVLMGWLGIVQETVKEPPTSDHLNAILKAALAIQKELEFTANYESVGVEKPIWVDVDLACKRGISDLNLDRVVVTIDLDGIEVLADQMLDKVFHNLADNSMRHGKKVTKIWVHYEESKGGLTLIYDDDGVGISKADKEKIFQRGEGKHTGFGLDLIKGILGITDIDISETGTPGKGARFEMLVTHGNYRIPPKHE
jgi:PAS domain S-box-containing protein